MFFASFVGFKESRGFSSSFHNFFIASWSSWRSIAGGCRSFPVVDRTKSNSKRLKVMNVEQRRTNIFLWDHKRTSSVHFLQLIEKRRCDRNAIWVYTCLPTSYQNDNRKFNIKVLPTDKGWLMRYHITHRLKISF